MAVTVVMTDRIFNPDGSITIVWGDSTAETFATFEDMVSTIEQLDTDSDVAKRLAMAWILARSADLSNISAIQDKNFIFDLSHPNAIRIQ